MRDTQKTTEDYLEAMLMMKEKRGFIRSVDVANPLGVTKPSVSYATRRLREAGYIEMDKDSFITLTPSGMETDDSLVQRLNAYSPMRVTPAGITMLVKARQPEKA